MKILQVVLLLSGLAGSLTGVCAGSESPVKEYRQLWAERTAGTNLALGVPVRFSQEPKYHLTSKGGTDAADLTDGKLSSRKDDCIWFDPAAVGWYSGGGVVNLLIDLKKQAPIGRVVIRCLGGAAQRNLLLPKKLEVLVSKDGVNYYRAASLEKLMPGEKANSNFKTCFFLDEKGIAFTYPFELSVDADARYVAMTVTGATDAIFTDELAVMEATPAEKAGKNFNSVYGGSSEAFIISGITVAPRINRLVVTEKVLTPNFLTIQDMRSELTRKKPVTLAILLPEGIRLIQPAPAKTAEATWKGKKYTRVELPLSQLGRRAQTDMLFFQADKDPGADAAAVFIADCEGENSLPREVPVSVMALPKIAPALKRIHVSLAWMGEHAQQNWPGFFESWRALGFNAVSTFPRNWSKTTAWTNQAFLDQARKAGFKVVMNESPFHIMAKKGQPGHEMFSQVIGSKSSNLCPSYRGDFYRAELDRVAENVRKIRPDYIFWDIECWYEGALEAGRCTRCSEAQRKSGKDMDEFLRQCGTESMRDLHAAVVKGSANGPLPVVASYNHHAVQPVHHLVVDFNQVYPEYVKLSQPSLYVVGRAQDVHDSIRKNFQLMKNRDILPWLSAGTYGEFEPYKLEPMILEALLNGAVGITYYCDSDFDTPLDYYYHAKALSLIAPYEDLIMDGQVMEPTGSNKLLTYSAIRRGREMLLLIGNYARAEEKTEVQLPFASVDTVQELRTGKKLSPAATLRLTVPKDDILLLYCRGK